MLRPGGVCSGGGLKAKAALDAKSRDENLRILRACLAEKDIVFTEEVNPEEPQLVLRGDFSPCGTVRSSLISGDCRSPRRGL